MFRGVRLDGVTIKLLPVGFDQAKYCDAYSPPGVRMDAPLNLLLVRS